jgi:hypothetical protein
MIILSFGRQELKDGIFPEQYQRQFDPCGAGDPLRRISIVFMVIGNKQFAAKSHKSG